MEILQHETEAFDMVLLDYPLPGMCVLDFLKEASAMNLDVPVSMISGQQSIRAAIKIIELNSHDYIPKSELLSPEYAAGLLGLPYKTIQSHIYTGRLKTYKGPRGQHCIRRQDVLNLTLFEGRPLKNELYRSYIEARGAFADAIDARDGIPSDHSRRAAAHVTALAERMGISGEEQERIKLAALLHALGKVFINEQTVKIPGELTDQERNLIRQHPKMGERIVSRVEFLKGGSPLIRYHHERYDGKGYHDGLLGREIPLGARIISLGESYDCITSDCIYHRGKSLAEAIEEIEMGAGTQFDPEIVEIFLKNKDEVTRRPLLN